MAEVLADNLELGHKVRNGGNTKKRRREEKLNGHAAKGDGTASKPSKEERREAKRLKKLQKEQGTALVSDGTIPMNDGLEEDHTATPKELRGRDVNETSKQSKEERREAKKLKKLQTEKDDVPEPEATVQPNSDLSISNKAVAKAARKAEKARLRAVKRVETNEKCENTDSSIPTTLKGDKETGEASRKKTIASTTPISSYTEHPTLTSLPQSEIFDYLSTNFITINDPTTTTTLRPITKFSYLPSTATSNNSPFTAFKTPTPIQSAAWPFLLSGRDVIGVAETGSGKTLAFGVPCIRSIASTPSSKPRKSPAKAVIVSPTRELAVQIHTQIAALAAPASLTTVCVYGGVPKDSQRLALKTAHIIVATPGRLKDLIAEGAADLSNVNYLVLDEADRMLDTGFEPDIRAIIATTATQGRQTLMFTATWPPSVRDLAATFMSQPVHISIGANNPTGELRANTKITQLVEVLDPREKEARLFQLIKKYQGPANKADRILIFCLYKKEAARVEQFLRWKGLEVTAIHGDMSQPQRQSSLDNFKSGSCPLLVATDVAARGLDIPAVKVVVNVTFPLTVEDYVHRIGRTGRAGAEGISVTLFTERDKGLAGGLINVLKAAGQDVPGELLKFGTTVKKKGHEAYGAFYKEVNTGGKKEGTKIRFDD
ncbi:RNA-dependent ATPase [Mycoblastus sanguinarius]|nr:RNA-dependent ATPase [Mycoblastus sanguinarius]